jgi:hypothetical protein
MDLRNLAPEERPEHAGLMAEAGYDETTGRVLPAHVIKQRLVRLLLDAEQAGRKWATYLMRDALANGLHAHWKSWDDAEKKLKFFMNGVIVPARAQRGVRRRTITGRVEHQRSFWREMSWAEVEQQIDDAEARIAAEGITKAIGFRLLKLRLEAPDSTGPGDACERTDRDFYEYLGLPDQEEAA